MATMIEFSKLKMIPKKHKVALCVGVYDVLSYAHFRHLQWAKSCGDILIVAVTKDEFVNKGNDRPVFAEKHRAEMLCALECTDYVVINPYPSAVKIIDQLSTVRYIKGADTERTPGPFFQEECEAVEEYGGTVMFSPEHL